MASRKPLHKAKRSPSQPSTSWKRFPVVCLGASAGGLEPFTKLLECLPATTGMAFIIIQHLDPSHPSALPPLLSKKSALPVTEAKDGVPVRRDHIYVIPPDTVMTLSGGALRLATRASEKKFMPIDSFMRSLAAELESLAVGVILSGTATDGTLGLEAIKAEGGVTFAQDEKSAQYPGMPASAAASGCVDFVLPPADIAKELVKLVGEPTGPSAERDPLEDVGASGSAEEFLKVFEMLRKETG